MCLSILRLRTKSDWEQIGLVHEADVCAYCDWIFGKLVKRIQLKREAVNLTLTEALTCFVRAPCTVLKYPEHLENEGDEPTTVIRYINITQYYIIITGRT